MVAPTSRFTVRRFLQSRSCGPGKSRSHRLPRNWFRHWTPGPQTVSHNAGETAITRNNTCIAGAFTLWLFAQFGFRSFAYHVQSRAFGPQIPLNEMGAFDLWACQLWWLVGLWSGVHWAKGDFRLDWARRMTIPAAIIAVFFLVLRYAQVDGEVTFGKSGLLLDKWDLGVGRIINFTAVSILATRFRSVLRFLAIKPLVMLGQSSQPVFCVHLLCVFFALTIMGNDPILRDWKGIVVIPTSLSALLLTRQNCHQPTGKRREKSSCGPRSVRLHARAVTNRGSQRIRWFERLLKIRTTSSSDNVQSQAAFSS